jgi:hypothetical protein
MGSPVAGEVENSGLSMWIVEAMRLGRLSLALLMVTDIASAGTTMESIGAEKCGGRVSAFEVEFLAPESAPLEATAKAIVRGAPDPAQDAVTLSIDGKPCTDARCAFQSRKGETYKLAATTKLRRFEELCVVVARP